jgi:iron complex transport system permease protein
MTLTARPHTLRARPLGTAILSALGIALGVVTVIALGRGALTLRPLEVIRVVLDALGFDMGEVSTRSHAVVINLRAPRVVMGLAVGAALGGSGAALQGLFRNPLADPGLLGVSSGAAAATTTVIVLGGASAHALGVYALPLAGFLGGLGAVGVVGVLGGAHARIETLLLTGVAITALAGAWTGALTFLATDAQLRSLTFWSLGSLGSASWTPCVILLPCVIASLAVMLRLSSALDLLALGESEAWHMGVSIARVRRTAIACSAVAVGASVAFTGVVGFVGLVAPHVIRLIAGPSHRVVVPGGALLGALLVVGSDTIARTIVAPMEVPLGVVTACFGAPFFLALLWRARARGDVL